MEEENVKKLGNAKYRAVEFTPCHPKDKACDHCAFELGKCRGPRVVFLRETDHLNLYYNKINVFKKS